MITLKKILVAVDFGEPSAAALTYGRELASRFGATLHVLHVARNIFIGSFGVENYASFVPEMQQQVEEEARKRLDAFLAADARGGAGTVPVVLTGGSPAFAVVDYAADHDIDLIVMGTHGRDGLAHLVMGSVAERVVRLAPCPVLTVRQPGHDFVVPQPAAAAAHA